MFAISSRNAPLGRPSSEVPVHVWALICFYAAVEGIRGGGLKERTPGQSERYSKMCKLTLGMGDSHV